MTHCRIPSLVACVACSVVLLLAGCARRPDMEIARTFQEAQKTFDHATAPDDYLRAAALYQKILDAGTVSGAILYNQGNAFMQAGQRGRALAAYRRAKRYRPRDPYLDANLAYAQGGQNTLPTRRPLIDYLFFWQDWLSYPEKFTLTETVALIAFALGIGALFTGRRLLKNLALTTVALTLLTACSAGYDWYRYDYLVHGVVVAHDVVARKGNATSYEPAFTKPLAEGTAFELIERRGPWLRVRLPGGQQAWLPAATVVLY